MSLDEKFYRKNYIDGTPRPLLRGVPFSIMTLFLCIYLVFNFYKLTYSKLLIFTLIFINYIFSSCYHLGISDKYEKIIHQWDHISIHFHIFASIVNLASYDVFSAIIFYIALENFRLDMENLLNNGYYYINSEHHLIYYRNAYLIAIFNYFLYLINNSVNLNCKIIMGFSYCVYLLGSLIYHNYRYYKKINKVWSFHETYHLCIIIGTIGNLLILN
jgi:hypothetical protein